MNAISHQETRSLGIVGICAKFGEQDVDIDWLVQQEHITKECSNAIQTAGTSRYFRSKNQSPEQLAVNAVGEVLQQSGIDPGAINYLIFTSTVFESTALYPDLIAQRIARQTGCTSAKAFALQHVYCVSPLAALQLLRAYSNHREEPSLGIIVSSDAMGDVTESLRAIGSLGLHSDGAVAILVSNAQHQFELTDIDLYMDGSRFRGQDSDGNILGGNLYFAMAAKLIRNIVRRNDISRDARIDLFANNLDINAWNSIGRILNIPEDRIHFDRHSGHVFGADPFINLKNAGRCQADYCILAATGVAGTFGAALLKVKHSD
jgi:3-oxoacyl-[acyl-carrier-protein] synthase III